MATKFHSGGGGGGVPVKTRVLYDSLSVFQWTSGFCAIAKEESNLKTKNLMLEYISDLMDDAQDFDFNSAKASLAVLLCHMEEGKVAWQETTKLTALGAVMLKGQPPVTQMVQIPPKSKMNQ